MKTAAILIGAVLATHGVPGQSLSSGNAQAAAQEAAKPQAQKFDLNFPGGSPRDLVAAIEKVTGKPLNILIQAQDEGVKIPPVKLTSVTVRDLFMALSMVSDQQQVVGGHPITTSFQFITRGEGDNAVWILRTNSTKSPPDSCLFFQLAGLLDHFTIDDITTAIQTGWDMLGINPKPRLKFHAETKLLIAVGPHDQLNLIDNVLGQLSQGLPAGGGGAVEKKGAGKTAPADPQKKDGPSAK